MAGLYLLQCGLASAQTIAAVDEASFLQPGHDGMEATTMLRMVVVIAAHTLVLEHHIFIG